MKVAEIMKRPAVTIFASASIAFAACRMRDRKVGMLVVLDQDRILGVVTDRDIVTRCIAGGAAPEKARVGDVMSPDVVTCLDTQTVEEAAALMGDHQLRRLPVRDAARRLVGVLSVDRIAEEYSEHLAGETLGEIVEARQMTTWSGGSC